MKISSGGLVKSTAWYTIGNLFVRSTSFLLLPLYSNLIEPNQFGKYALLISFYTIASAFYQMGLPSGLSKFYIEENDISQKRTIFSTTINILIINSAVISVFVIFFSKQISALILNQSEYSDLVIILFISLAVETVSTQILQLLKTKEQAKKVVLFTGISSVINLALNIFLVLILKFGIWGIIVSQTIASVGLLIILFPSLKKEYLFVLEKKIAKKIIIFCLPILLAGIFNYGVDVIDRFIIDIFYGQEEVGIYSFCYRIAMVMNLFVISFRAAWLPYSLKLYYSNDYKEKFGNAFIKLISIGVFILLVGSLFADDLFNINIIDIFLFDNAYKSGFVIIPFVLLGYLFNGVASFYFVYPLAGNKSSHFVMADGIAFFVNLIMNFILIPTIGIIGAAIATTLSYITSAFYLFYVSKDKVIIKYPKNQLYTIILSTLLLFVIGFMFKKILIDLALIVVLIVLISKVLRINPISFFKESKTFL